MRHEHQAEAVRPADRFFATGALLLALVLHDRRTLGRIHPVTLWAALLLVPFHAAGPFIARSGPWNAIAPALFGFG